MEKEVESADGTVTISTSIGVTFFSKNKSFDVLYKEADEALYRSKENGRNQITIYT
ncbi:MAG: diguanylate cyclase [Ruminococcaceae bacterium]|nr:diguanylate cyclase [Oscillospiraceae bacterium]